MRTEAMKRNGWLERTSADDDRQRETADLDMTPMVDVTFLLLIFFMVTAAFTIQKSLEVPTPHDDEPSLRARREPTDEDPTMISVVVDSNNTYQLTTNDWEQEVPSVSELYRMIRIARQGDSSGVVPTKLRVRAHEECFHEFVVSAIDAGAAAGMSEIQLQSIRDDEI